MKTNRICSLLAGLVIATAGLLFTHNIAAKDKAETKSLATLAREATSASATESEAAIKSLRVAGTDGLQALSEVYSNQITAHSLQARIGSASAVDENWERIRAAFDAVGEQHDCYASQLFWFTDMEQAKAAARASGKPILSLRLLGKLNEEYSCANSRFFRTTLYANTEVAKYLREHFVLHWQSVRPVPRITIDMGDGRKIERTITGNSIHYILDAEGNPIDALPGLYGAKAFLAGLSQAVEAEQAAVKLNGNERETFLKNYHETRLAEIQEQWSRDLAQVGNVGAVTPISYTAKTGSDGASLPPNADGVTISSTSSPDALKAGRLAIGKGKVEMAVLQSSLPGQSSGAVAGSNPDAIAAAPRALFKSQVEVPMLRAGAQPGSAADRARLEASSNDATWQTIAALHANDARLDASAYGLVASKQSPDEGQKAMRLTASKAIVETPMMRMMHNLERSIAEDTVRNEYQMHTRILEWFVNGSAPKNVDALNKKVYAELFLTPDSDPWLGLAPADTFTALDHGGLVQSPTKQ